MTYYFTEKAAYIAALLCFISFPSDSLSEPLQCTTLPNNTIQIEFARSVNSGELLVTHNETTTLSLRINGGTAIYQLVQQDLPVVVTDVDSQAQWEIDGDCSIGIKNPPTLLRQGDF